MGVFLSQYDSTTAIFMFLGAGGLASLRRAKASREECERAERDLSDLRDQNAAQSTALIKATDTAQADRASRPVWKAKFHDTRHTG